MGIENMKPNNTNPRTEHETMLGTSKRNRYPDREASEKSLLSLIEERRTNVARSFLGISPEVDESSLGDGFDDIDDADRPGLDQLMIRLGGNGF